MSDCGSAFAPCSSSRICVRRGCGSSPPPSRLRPRRASGCSNAPRGRGPPPPPPLEPEAVERLLKRAERLGRVARVADNRYFLPETLARLAEIARDLADGSAERPVTAAPFKNRSGI